MQQTVVIGLTAVLFAVYGTDAGAQAATDGVGFGTLTNLGGYARPSSIPRASDVMMPDSVFGQSAGKREFDPSGDCSACMVLIRDVPLEVGSRPGTRGQSASQTSGGALTARSYNWCPKGYFWLRDDVLTKPSGASDTQAAGRCVPLAQLPDPRDSKPGR